MRVWTVSYSDGELTHAIRLYRKVLRTKVEMEGFSFREDPIPHYAQIYAVPTFPSEGEAWFASYEVLAEDLEEASQTVRKIRAYHKDP